MFDEHMVLLFPAAVYALSAGYDPFMHCYKGLPLWYPFADVNEAMSDWDKVLLTYEYHMH